MATIDTKFLLEPGVPDLVALGATTPEDLIGTGDPLEGEPLAERLGEARGSVTLRVPLPGTLKGRPRGGGTGWMILRRFQGGAGRWAARFTHPRSDSLAGREWNLLCALRRAGVVTAAPLALAYEGHPLFSRRSALVTRALEDVVVLSTWLEGASTLDRRRLCVSLGLTLARLDAGGFDLPLSVDRLGVLETEGDRPDTVEDACGLEQVLAARHQAPRGEALDFSRGMRWRRLPEVVLTEVTGGRMRSGPTLERLAEGCSAWSVLSDTELRRVVLTATPDARRRRRLLTGR